MQKKYWLVPGIIAAILVASLIALSNPKTPAPTEKPVCCKKVQKKCISQPREANSDETTLDNLSTQFISFPLRY
jgi:hypothetical protein